MNWGDRVGLEEGSAAVFGCYGQEMPATVTTRSDLASILA
ncbi:MAG: hypothetical protein QOG79_1586 [Mycobacterium sp.]|jgi:hypothetical protein|nr:hypothetical protein [Mycobacterium sp.]MDT5361620.1 hypothetical protein [Mycobacterium sp.]